jgi:hypothetical protein
MRRKPTGLWSSATGLVWPRGAVAKYPQGNGFEPGLCTGALNPSDESSVGHHTTVEECMKSVIFCKFVNKTFMWWITQGG